MQNFPTELRLSTIAVVTICLLTSCSWVDSTGQSGSASSISRKNLVNAQAVDLLEDSITIGELTGVGETLKNWQWQLQSSDVRNRCENFTGFDLEYAQTDLNLACSSDDCTFAIDENASDGNTSFTFRLPQLRAPVALSYLLNATRSDGAVIKREQVFCGVSINEAPFATDDQYSVVVGELAEIRTDSSNGLLANDTDDVDSRNQPLRVLPTPIQGPRYANQFLLEADGSFFYQVDDTLSINDNQDISDTFIYAVTDGIHTSQASVNVTLTQQNSPPRALETIPDSTIQLTSRSDEKSDVIDLNQYFNDPDDDTLSFSKAVFPTLLQDVTQLSPEGQLSITATYPLLGYWVIPFSVSDGTYNIESQLGIEIRLDEGTELLNSPPEVDDISNRIVQNSFSYNISEFFVDPDSDPMTFTARGLPTGVSMTTDGNITGIASAQNQGTWFVVVTATDALGLSADDGFLLIIN